MTTSADFLSEAGAVGCDGLQAVTTTVASSVNAKSLYVPFHRLSPLVFKSATKRQLQCPQETLGTQADPANFRV